MWDFNDNIPLNVEFDIRAKDFDVPALSIQPLVENSVKYGVCKKIGGGTVSIKTRDGGDAWMIIIADDGVGFDVSKVNWTDGKHHGINNLRKRIEYQCGGTVDIDSSVGVGTSVTVTLPKKKPDDALAAPAEAPSSGSDFSR